MPTAILDDTGTIVALSDSWRDSVRTAHAAGPVRGEPGNDYLSLFGGSGDGNRFDEWLAGVRSVLDARCETFELYGGLPHADGRYIPRATRLPMAEGRIVLSVTELATGAPPEIGAPASQPERERRFQALIEGSSDAITLLDAAGVVSYASPGNIRLIGHRPEEFVGTRLIDLIDPNSRAEFARHFAKAIDNPGVPVDVSMARVAPDGGPRRLEGQITSLLHDPGVRAVVCFCRDVTRQDRQQAALMQAHQEVEVFRTMVEFASQAIGTSDLNARVTYMNPAMLRLLGLSSLNEARRHTFESFYRDEDLEFLRREVIPAVMSRGRWTGELQVRPQGQEPVATIHNVYLLRDPQGRPFAFSNVVTDISRQKRTEQSLRKSEAKYRQLFEASADGISLLDADSGVLIDCNDALCRMSGRSRDELVGHLHGHARLRLVGAGNGRADKNAPGDIPSHEVREGQIVAPSGQVRDVEISTRLIDLDGRSVVQAVYRDVTDRKRAETALEKRIVALTRPMDEHENVSFEDLFDLADIQRLQDLFADAFGVASLITTPDGTPITRPSNFCGLCANIIRTSAVGLKNCNRSDAEIGRHNRNGPNIQACLSAGLCNAGASITVGGRHVANWLIGQVRSEAQNDSKVLAYAHSIGADEEAFRAAYLKVPFMPQQQFDSAAKVLFEFANQISTSAYQNLQQARFIAERRRAEEALRNLNATLEQRVLEVVAKNREKDHLLIQQSRLAAMGEMIGNIAHQWRQPINALALLLANIKDAYSYGDLDAAYLKHQVDRGDQLIQKMSATIEDFRNFFRPNRERQAFRLSSIVGDALTIVESAFHHHHIDIDVDIRNDAAVLGFPNEYTQVLLNLLSNARDAIEAHGATDGRVAITVDCAGSEARLTVSDNGGGIAADVLPKIFDPYFTTRESGTGIGLYMSKMIVEANMNGRIEARNTATGAEFIVATPINRPIDRGLAAPSQLDPGTPPSAPSPASGQ